jgi:hypothetical protein
MQKFLQLWHTLLYMALILTVPLALFLLVFAWTQKSGLLVIPLVATHALAIFSTKHAIKAGKPNLTFVVSQIPFVVGGGWLFYATNLCGHC